MLISVFSLKNILFQGEAKSLTCDTATGELTILDHHEPLITSLTEGLIKILDKTEKLKYIQVSSGFIEINGDNQIRCIIEEKI